MCHTEYTLMEEFIVQYGKTYNVWLLGNMKGTRHC
jgi:hypothetical protein